LNPDHGFTVELENDVSLSQTGFGRRTVGFNAAHERSRLAPILDPDTDPSGGLGPGRNGKQQTRYPYQDAFFHRNSS
jgi:hypothetical protein